MDPFDDFLPVDLFSRTRLGAKFIPKAKSKQPSQKEIPTSEHATSSKDGILGNECQKAVASTLSMQTEKSNGYIHQTQAQVEILNSEDSTNSETRNPKQVTVQGDGGALVDDSTIITSDVDTDQNSTNFLKPICESNPVDFVGGSVTNFVPETNLTSGPKQPVHPTYAVENELSNLAAPSATCSTMDRITEPSKNEEDLGFKSSSDNKVAMIQSNDDSKSNFRKEQEVVSAEFELDPFSNILPDLGARNVHKFKPKIKPRPRVGNTPTIASASSNVMIEKSVKLPPTCTNKFQSFQSCGDGSGRLNQSTSLPLPTSNRTTDFPNKFGDTSSSISFSEDNKSLASSMLSQLDSVNAIHSEDAVYNGVRDCPSSFGKLSGESADIFCGLESLDGFPTQATTDIGKPALHSFNGKGAEENFVTSVCGSVNMSEYHGPQDLLTFNEAAVLNEDDMHTNKRRSKSEEIGDLNPGCPGEDVFDYQSMNSGIDPISGIPVHEDLSNAADSPTLTDFLHDDVTREKQLFCQDANKRKRDGSTSNALKKNRRSSIAGEEDKGGKTLRQLRKQAARKPANNSLNEDVEDNNDLDPTYNSNGNELQDTDDDYEVNYSSKKKRVSTSSRKKPVVKSGKTSQKHKRANDALEKTKEPPKKFPHSTRRRKRCLDKAQVEILEDELDNKTLPLKDVIFLGDYRDRLAKKEAMTSNMSSTNKSGGDSVHETGAYDEWEFSGSEDGRDPFEERANEGITTTTFTNYQTHMRKEPRGSNWSKQDTELFYKGDGYRFFFSMIQLLFPDRSRAQIKTKYNTEGRLNPFLLTDAINNRAKDYDLWADAVKLASTKAKDEPSGDPSDFMMAEEVNADATIQEDGVCKANEDSVAVHSPDQSDDSDYDNQELLEYKSIY